MDSATSNMPAINLGHYLHPNNVCPNRTARFKVQEKDRGVSQIPTCYFERIHTEGYEKMLCAICALETVQRCVMTDTSRTQQTPYW